jgi:hypothetical protein
LTSSRANAGLKLPHQDKRSALIHEPTFKQAATAQAGSQRPADGTDEYRQKRYLTFIA